MSTTLPTAASGAVLPRGWLAVALLTWGALTDNLAGALVMAALVEGLTFGGVRWHVVTRDFHRAADLTSVVFAAVTLLLFNRHGVHGIYPVLAATPYCFFVLVLVERASTRQALPMSALFYSLRREGREGGEVAVAAPYAALCLLAASTTAARDGRFVVLALLVVGGLLLRRRPHRYRWPAFLATLTLALALTAALAAGVERGQRWFEGAALYWINQFPWRHGDPNRAVTAIGAIGRLKLSDQVRLRVTAPRPPPLPLILQEASYDRFQYGNWSAVDAPFAALDQLPGRRAWALAKPRRGGQVFDITAQHGDDLTLLPLPAGSRLVESGEIAEVQRNRLGTVMAEAAPGALRFEARADGLAAEAPPTARDSEVPTSYQALVSRVGKDIYASDDPPTTRLARIERYFADHFSYSLVRQGGPPWRTPLAHFLERTRRGHCEYFATATVLLLRAAGIPARYAVGYVVDEYSGLEGAWIARARDAHAWALAYVDGRWVRVDTTPARWWELEDAAASDWQGLGDLGAWLVYRLQRLGQADFAAYEALLPWLVPPLAVVLYLRLRRNPNAVRATGRARAPRPGGTLASLYAALAVRGLEPLPGETPAAFLRRAAPAEAGGQQREALLARYYRLRFAATAGTDATLADDLARYTAGLAAAAAQDAELASASR